MMKGREKAHLLYDGNWGPRAKNSDKHFKFGAGERVVPSIFQIPKDIPNSQIPRFSIEKLKSTDDANGDDLILGGSGKVRVWNVKSNISRASQA